MLELYQAEWCPYSRRVRQRMTELGLDVTLRQVAAEREQRGELERVSGQRGIPVLVLEDGSVITGSEAILDRLDALGPEPPGAARHREKAADHAG